MDQTTTIKTDEFNRVSNKTRVMIKKQKDEEEQQKKQEAAKAIKLKKEGLSKYQRAEKTSTFGHFVQSKKATLGEELQGIDIDLVNPDGQKVKKLVDISIIRRGLNYHGATDRDLKIEKDEILKEEELQEREKAINTKKDKKYGKEEKKK